MVCNKILYVALVLIALLGASPLQAGPLDTSRHPHPKIAQAVHEAQHAVDRAWEAYHRAALGGTVASPTLQTEIEDHLSDARELVTEARVAAGQGDAAKVQDLVRQVKAHADKALKGSKEHKK
ncbi:MAG: hypothetical protein JW388_1578 [Nitrospira sp.]|nr:hypothetical protein [Nitrospira sp.]